MFTAWYHTNQWSCECCRLLSFSHCSGSPVSWWYYYCIFLSWSRAAFVCKSFYWDMHIYYCNKVWTKSLICITVAIIVGDCKWPIYICICICILYFIYSIVYGLFPTVGTNLSSGQSTVSPFSKSTIQFMMVQCWLSNYHIVLFYLSSKVLILNAQCIYFNYYATYLRWGCHRFQWLVHSRAVCWQRNGCHCAR